MFLLSAAFWSTMRVFIAYCISLLIGILYGIFSATNLHRERWMLPLLDILQSVPILGFFPVAVTILVVLFHGQRIGLELAAIFLIVTSQLWNIAFGVYETIKTFPKDLLEMTQSFGMNVTFTVEHIYLPALVPTIIYNSGVSIAVGWYFLMASEIITLGNVEVQLPGLGTAMMAYVSQGNLLGTFGVIGMIVLVNFITQWFIFRPLIEWSDLFKFGAVGSAPEEPRLVTILRNSIPWQKISEWINRLIQLGRRFQKSPVFSRVSHYFDFQRFSWSFWIFFILDAQTSLSRYHKGNSKKSFFYNSSSSRSCFFIGHSLLPIRCESNSNSKKCEKHLPNRSNLRQHPCSNFLSSHRKRFREREYGVSCYYFIVNRIFLVYSI